MYATLMGLKTTSPQKLNELIIASEVTVFDMNTPERWAQYRVPGVINLTPGQFGRNDLPEDKAGLLVFYCSNPLCRKAPLAARQAKEWGYTNVFVMSAGIKGWLSENLPVENGKPRETAH